MSRNLRQCLNCMDIYHSTKNSRMRKNYLKEISKEEKFFEALFEIVNNIYLGKFDLKRMKPAQKKKIRKYANIMDKIHRRPKRKSMRKKIVNQSGGFIQFILPELVTEIIDLIKDASSKKSNVGTT